jgi:HEAT repeat protein
MSLTHSNSSFPALRPAILAAVVSAAIVGAACVRDKPAGRDAAKAGGNRAGASREVGVVVSVDGKTVDDLETTISLNPCKGETPGEVLGVSEQADAPRRVAAFVGKLRDAEPKARACAARQLGYLGAEARDALPHIIRRMREEEHDGVGVNLSEALWAIGPDTKAGVGEWLESLHADDAEVRLYAAFALGYYKPHPARQKEVVGALAAATRDKDGGVRWMAVRGLMRLGPSAVDAVPDLLAVLLDEKSSLRHLAALALGNVGPGAEAAAPELLKVLYNAKDYHLYSSASIALGRIGPAVVPLLAKDLKTNKTLRVLDVLEHLAPHGAPLVVEALRMKNKEVRGKALDIVWHFGTAAEPAVPLLIKGLKDEDKDLRHKAAFAISLLGPVAKAAAPALLAALGDKDDLVRCYAAKALGEVGPEGAPAVPELRRLMSIPVEGERDVPQRCAAEALMRMGPETRALVPPEMAKRVEDFYKMVEGIGGDYRADETRPKPKEKKEAAAPVW